MATLTIHTYPGNPRVFKALIAAQYNNVKVNVPAGFEFGKDNQTKEFEAKFPAKKVPAMETPFGPLYESGAILRYIARLRPDTGLLGSSFYHAALVDQWLDWSGFELEPARAAWLYPLWKILPFNDKAYQAAKEEVHKSLRLIDNHLASCTYLVGNQITLADIAVVCACEGLVKMVLTEADAKKYGNFARWFATCVNQPQFSAVLGEVKWAASETKAEGAGESKQEKPQGEKKEKPKKEPKEPKEQGKKEEKPKKEPKEQGKKEDKPKKEQGKKEEGKKEEKPKGGDNKEQPKSEKGKNESGKKDNKKGSKKDKEETV
jgi:elongation factor 1-gamma